MPRARAALLFAVLGLTLAAAEQGAGPYLAYRFDGDANDAKGHAAITFTGSSEDLTEFVPGALRQALQLGPGNTGDTDIYAPTIAGLDTTADYSIAAWVYATPDLRVSILTNKVMQWWINGTAETATFKLAHWNTAFEVEVPFQMNQWTHVATVYRHASTTTTVFINGAQVASLVNQMDYSQTYPFYLNSDLGTVAFDELYFYSWALAASQVEDLFTDMCREGRYDSPRPPCPEIDVSGPVAEWWLDGEFDPYIGTVPDDLMVVDDSAISYQWVPGAAWGALHIYGSEANNMLDAYVPRINFAASQDWTFAGFFKFNHFDGAAAPAFFPWNSATAAYGTFSIWADPANGGVSIYAGVPSAGVMKTYTVPSSTWVHIALVYEYAPLDPELQVYINGELQDTLLGLASWNSVLPMGLWSRHGAFYDDLTFWGRYLYADEIYPHYRRFCTDKVGRYAPDGVEYEFCDDLACPVGYTDDDFNITTECLQCTQSEWMELAPGSWGPCSCTHLDSHHFVAKPELGDMTLVGSTVTIPVLLPQTMPVRHDAVVSFHKSETEILSWPLEDKGDCHLEAIVNLHTRDLPTADDCEIDNTQQDYWYVYCQLHLFHQEPVLLTPHKYQEPPVYPTDDPAPVDPGDLPKKRQPPMPPPLPEHIEMTRNVSTLLKFYVQVRREVKVNVTVNLYGNNTIWAIIFKTGFYPTVGLTDTILEGDMSIVARPPRRSVIVPTSVRTTDLSGTVEVAAVTAVTNNLNSSLVPDVTDRDQRWDFHLRFDRDAICDLSSADNFTIRFQLLYDGLYLADSLIWVQFAATESLCALKSDPVEWTSEAFNSVDADFVKAIAGGRQLNVIGTLTYIGIRVSLPFIFKTVDFDITAITAVGAATDEVILDILNDEVFAFHQFDCPTGLDLTVCYSFNLTDPWFFPAKKMLVRTFLNSTSITFERRRGEPLALPPSISTTATVFFSSPPRSYKAGNSKLLAGAAQQAQQAEAIVMPPQREVVVRGFSLGGFVGLLALVAASGVGVAYAAMFVYNRARQDPSVL